MEGCSGTEVSWLERERVSKMGKSNFLCFLLEGGTGWGKDCA